MATQPVAGNVVTAQLAIRQKPRPTPELVKALSVTRPYCFFRRLRWLAYLLKQSAETANNQTDLRF